MTFLISITWVSWLQTCAFKPNNLTSYFQRCGCASPAHAGSTMKIIGRLQYGAVPHICPSTQDMSSSYPWGSPMLFSHPFIVRGLQPPLLYLCNALFRYVLWLTHPAPLLLYRFTYGQQSPGIGNSDLPLHSLDMIISDITMGIMVFFCVSSCY